MAKVIVAGSVNMDIVAFADKLPAKGETVLGSSLKYFPGGKGSNQAIASSRMGAETHFIGCVGDDAFADTLSAYLKDANVQTHIRKVPGISTGTALITVSSTDNIITVVPGANLEVKADDLCVAMESGDVALAQFEIDLATVGTFFAAARKKGATTALNPSPFTKISERLLTLTDILIVNEGELSAIAGLDSDPEENAKRVFSKGLIAVIVTMGADGVLAVDSSGSYKIKPHKVIVEDTTGAGDCFAGALAASLCRGLPLRDAAELANKAAALSVTRQGASTSSPILADVIAYFKDQ